MDYQSFSQNDQERLIDLRPAVEVQKAYYPSSYHFTCANMLDFLPSLISKDLPLAWVGDPDKQADLLDLLPGLVDQLQDLGYQTTVNIYDITSFAEADLIELATISPEEFLTLDENYILLDLRDPQEITRPAPEKNLLNIPTPQLANRINELDPDITIYTLCGSGGRATLAAIYLANHGYKTCIIEGGMKAVQNYQNR